MDPSSLVYDKNAYEIEIAQSKATGNYYLQTPSIKIDCFPDNPEITAQSGNEVSKLDLVDVDSELMGITRKHSNDPRKKFNPHTQEKHKKKSLTNCYLNTEPTRFSNPPCTLRGTGWNRWEWLGQDPQENVIPQLNFRMTINESLEARDKFIPCIPKPLDDKALPPPVAMEKQEIKAQYT